MILMNKPACENFEKCQSLAITLFHKKWLCGPCMMKRVNRMKEAMEKLMVEESNGSD